MQLNAFIYYLVVQYDFGVNEIGINIGKLTFGYNCP